MTACPLGNEMWGEAEVRKTLIRFGSESASGHNAKAPPQALQGAH